MRFIRDFLPHDIPLRLALTFLIVFAITAGVAYLIGGTSTVYVPALGAATVLTALEYTRVKRQGTGKSPAGLGRH